MRRHQNRGLPDTSGRARTTARRVSARCPEPMLRPFKLRLVSRLLPLLGYLSREASPKSVRRRRRIVRRRPPGGLLLLQVAAISWHSVRTCHEQTTRVWSSAMRDRSRCGDGSGWCLWPQRTKPLLPRYMLAPSLNARRAP